MNGAEERMLNGALAALRRGGLEAGAPRRTEEALLNAFHAHRRGRGRARWAAGAAAALLLVAMSFAVLRTAKRPPAAPLRPFIPVAYAEPLHPGDAARVVTVRMPRSALIQLGLPANEALMTERIEAEVLLGEDNLVRAVRFVH